MTLDFLLDRTITIQARRATVFRYFTDPERWARWWGAGSTITPTVGGVMSIVYPNGVRVSGVVREIVDGERIAFTYGYDSGTPVPPGATLVTITLSDTATGATRLALRHAHGDAATRDAHVQGWAHQLAVFAHVVADEAFAHAPDAIATWFEAWRTPARAAELLAPVCAADVHFRDAHGDVVGVDELVAQIAALAKFMAGVTLGAASPVRRSRDVALVDFAAMKGDAKIMGGTNVFRFAPDGRIAEVTGVS